MEQWWISERIKNRIWMFEKVERANVNAVPTVVKRKDRDYLLFVIYTKTYTTYEQPMEPTFSKPHVEHAQTRNVKRA